MKAQILQLPYIQSRIDSNQAYIRGCISLREYRKLIIRRLNLSNFRNFSRLDIDLPPRISIIQGENAQGKSNLLEAVYFISTSRSPRAGNDMELINWSALDEELPVSRLVADVQKTDGNLSLEM